MERADVGRESDPTTAFLLAMKACSNASFAYGTNLHGSLIKKGLESQIVVANTTMDFYAKSGLLDAATRVFHGLTYRDSVTWNVMVYSRLGRGCCGDGLHWFDMARLDGFEPNNSVLVLVIHACRGLKAKKYGSKVHGFLIKSGFVAIDNLRNSLLTMYADWCEMGSARKMFDEIPERDIVSWSAIIKGYASAGEAEAGLKMFASMASEDDIEPDGVMAVSVLRACAGSGDADMGKSVHALAVRRGLDHEIFVGNSLIDMYSKCDDPGSAMKAFEEMPDRSIVTWNSAVAGLVLNRKYTKALSMLDPMWSDGFRPDPVTLVTVLQICKHFGEPSGARSVHCIALRRRLGSNEEVTNSLIEAYLKSGRVHYARRTFRSADTEKSRVTWSIMIVGLARLGDPAEAISMFAEMARADEKPSAVTILNLIEACSLSADLRAAKWAHGIAVRRELAGIEIRILDMYGKCGDLEAARRVFRFLVSDGEKRESPVGWGAMIFACAANGRAHEALSLHEEMVGLFGVDPNAVTALGVLSACRHAGLLDEGLRFFSSMGQVERGPEHYSCVVDMLGRAGRLGPAKELIEKMPRGLRSDAKAWGSLLSACRSHGDGELGSEAARRVVELEPEGSSGYLMGSAVYALSGLWAQAAGMRRMVKERGVKVAAGYSAVHIAGRDSCKFVAGDFSHSSIGDIKSMVENLHGCMKKIEDEAV